ncbi:PAS domain-containing protein [Leisingera caerulea]|uniref:PAS domain-containing protein n=1 Tax=Leisingera caerulea TaxID=506591 RepID=UPI0021A38E65|nr:PAS domain-containing protein [Leisingera caerulea]UWQ64341.1 PAS domain-containing protein [Leisingera caerulea]
MIFGSRSGTGTTNRQDKVVSMNRFRKGGPLSPLRQAEAYWTALRRGDDVPSRSQIDPRGLENILSHTFILERIAPGIARFRLAGSTVNDMAGMEVRGMPITAFFTTDARKQLSSAMEHMFETPAIVELELQIEAPRLRTPREARMLMLPLRSDLGDISRVLGVLVADEGDTATSQRFSISSIEMRAVAKAPDLAGFKAKPRPDAPAPAGTPAAKEERRDVNQPNPGFAETQARFKPERSILDEAKALLDRSRASRPAAPAETPAAAPAKRKGAPHLRLVVSRD